jgi:hypothetical protein
MYSSAQLGIQTNQEKEDNPLNILVAEDDSMAQCRLQVNIKY